MPTIKKFKTVEDLEEKIEGYFKRCDKNKKDTFVEGKLKKVPRPIPYTIEGLAAWLEVSRMTLLNYSSREGYEEYFYTIKKAKQRILANLQERALMGDNVASITIFNLKNNYGYVDAQILTGANGAPLHAVNVSFTSPGVKPIHEEDQIEE